MRGRTNIRKVGKKREGRRWTRTENNGEKQGWERKKLGEIGAKDSIESGRN